MNRKRKGLGRGLGALLPQEEEDASRGILYIPIDAIRPNPRQPRQHMTPETLQELAASIREHGILQPLIVSRGEKPGEYILVAGERRWRAARAAGLERVPVIVRELSERERLEWALVENVQRADLNPLEEAEAYRQLHEEFGLSHAEIAQRVGKSRVAVTNTLRLLKLSEPVKAALMAGDIQEGHARALLALSPADQVWALEEIRRRHLTVRQTEDLVRRRLKQTALDTHSPPQQTRSADPILEDAARRLERRLNTRVEIRGKPSRGRIVLHFYSEEELQALLDRLLGG